MLPRSCQRCDAHFVPTQGGQRYCPACATAVRARVCECCGRSFQVENPSRPGSFCSHACRNKVHAVTNKGRTPTLTDRHCELCGAPFHPLSRTSRFCCRQHFLEWKRNRGRTSVRCVWPQCPRPDDLISLIRSRAVARHDRAYHPECYQAYQQAGGWRKGQGKGAVISCQICGDEIGYRAQCVRKQKYHLECYRRLKNRAPRGRKGEMRPCAHCGTPVFRSGARARARRYFCSAAHRAAWFATHAADLYGGRELVPRVDVRCTACGQSRTFRVREAPSTVDRRTLTWTCPACRPKTVIGEATCAYCGVCFRTRLGRPDPCKRHFCCHEHMTKWQHEQRRVVRVPCAQCCRDAAAHKIDYKDAYFELPKGRRHHPGRPHFCTKQHLAVYNRAEQSRTARCQQCGSPFKRAKGHTTFCSQACYAAWKRGRPMPTRRPSAAEEAVRAAFAKGIRTVKGLARESKTDPRTVRKILKEGKLSPDASTLA